MRLLATVATIASIGAAALAGQTFWRATQGQVPERQAMLSQGGEVAPVGQGVSTDEPAQMSDWPALFGLPVVEEPQPPAPAPEPAPEAEPQPPAPPAPPIESLGYSLKGVVSDADNHWAIVSHPTGDVLMKVGDILGETYTITAIDAQGLWGKSSPHAEPQLLGFAK